MIDLLMNYYGGFVAAHQAGLNMIPRIGLVQMTEMIIHR